MLKKIFTLLTFSIFILFLSVPIFPGGDKSGNPKGADPWDDVKSAPPSNGSGEYRVFMVGSVSLFPQIIIISLKDQYPTTAVTKGKNGVERVKGVLSSSKTNKK
jgi:hypothetical protein